MKKNRFLFVIVILSLLLLGNSQAEKEGIKLLEFSEHSMLKTSLNLVSEEVLSQIIILPVTSFNQAEAAQIISRIDRLPLSLLEKVHKEGIIIQLFNGKLTETKAAAHLENMVPRGYVQKTTWDEIPGMGGGKVVLVKIGASHKGKGHGSVNLELHELAHSVDRLVYNELRDRQSYLEIWNLEKGNMFPDKKYYLLYPEEYFAECFAFYYLGGQYREELKRKAPLTYQYIKNLF
ncbi:anthrax toxin lethal factor-related metalloendopeptidase [Niallia endozanthoxylica]|uniref:Toxin n=1 Tax=Niallia endozanthoxylica TaxID=2036016 RepID=A0A5J5HQH1_9BACI|nr:toxin [Niallia endozanthoxylica]KAA9021687.1 toxin [Niallia endozanthoxylica]